MSTGRGVADEKLNNTSGSNIPKHNEVYLALVDHLQPRWYDVFLCLGIEREILDKCLKDHPFDNHSALLLMIDVWVQRKNPPPSWLTLVDVLRNNLLETEIADTIIAKYCPDLVIKVHRKDSVESADDPPPFIDEESLEFSKLLNDIAEKLGMQSFSELQHYLLQMKCPDGTPLVDPDNLYGRRSTEDLIAPLIASNLFSNLDLDPLIHVLHGLQRDDLLHLVSAFVPKVTVGKPTVSEIPDQYQVFVVKVNLNQAIKQLDLGIVSAIKHDLCACFAISQKPYLIQYIGWKQDPIVLHFQVPFPCMHLVEDGLKHSLSELHGNGIDTVELDICGVIFSHSLCS